jgi:hypothetical protein
VAGAGLLAVLAAGLATSATAAAKSATPQLSITLDDGVTQVRSDTDVSYTAKVSNHGSAAVHATLVLATPGYVAVTRAAGATVTAHAATWSITVMPGKSAIRTAKAHIGTIAKTDYRVTTLASVFRGKSTTGLPLIRTAVANKISGVTDPAHTVTSHAASATSRHGSSGTNWALVAVLPAAVLAALLAGGFLWRRRGRHEPAEPAARPVTEPAKPAAQPAALRDRPRPAAPTVQRREQG